MGLDGYLTMYLEKIKNLAMKNVFINLVRGPIIEKLISVIMSVYNESEYIAEAIESILKQTYKKFEFIIVDDCSTDETPEIIKHYAESDNRIIFVQNETNLGLTQNLNKALNISNGAYIARMDGDDISLPERFERQIEFLNEHKEIMLFLKI